MRCYDGCGQEVRGMGLRAANRQGARATAVMERLRATRATVRGTEKPGAALERLAHYESLLGQVLTSCHEVLHGERSYKEIDWKLVRSTIQEADRFVTLLRREP